MSDNILVPDFRVYSSALEPFTKGAHPLFPALPESTEDMPVLTVVSSSTEEDLHGDTMALTALQDMADTPIGQNCFRNHSYSLPGDYFGKTLAKSVIVADSKVADLHDAFGVYVKDSENAKTYDQIKNFNARHGISVGVMVLEWAFDGDDWFSPIIIHHVQRVETSIVGIPASQRSWVENAIGGIFVRYINEDNGEDALKLAPAYKGLFSNDYKELVKSLRSEGLRKELERQPVRAATGNAKARLAWEPLKKHFVLQVGNRSQTVERDTIPDLLKTYSARPKIEAPMNKEESVTEEEAPPQEAVEETTITTEETPEENTEEENKSVEPTEVDLSGVPNIKAYANTLLEKAFSDLFFAIKAGAEISKENAGYVEQIHAMVCNLVGNTHCEAVVGTTSNDEDETKSLEALVTKAVKEAYREMEPTTLVTLEDNSHNMDGVIKSLEDFSAQLETVKGLPGLQTEIGVLTKSATELRSFLDKEFERAKLRINAISDDLHTLTNVPLGNPKRFERTVEPSQDVTSYDELLNVNSVRNEPQSVLECKALTTVVKETRIDGAIIEYRHWPEGVGKGIRPALTMNQQNYMHPHTWSVYQEGHDCYVPMVDDPFEKLEKASAKR